MRGQLPPSEDARRKKWHYGHTSIDRKAKSGGRRKRLCLPEERLSCQECGGTLTRDRHRWQEVTERQASSSTRRGRAQDYRDLALMLPTSTVLKLNQLTNRLASGQEAALQPAPFYGWTSRVSDHEAERTTRSLRHHQTAVKESVFQQEWECICLFSSLA